MGFRASGSGSGVGRFSVGLGALGFVGVSSLLWAVRRGFGLRGLGSLGFWVELPRSGGGLQKCRFSGLGFRGSGFRV